MSFENISTNGSRHYLMCIGNRFAQGFPDLLRRNTQWAVLISNSLCTFVGDIDQIARLRNHIARLIHSLVVCELYNVCRCVIVSGDYLPDGPTVTQLPISSIIWLLWNALAAIVHHICRIVVFWVHQNFQKTRCWSVWLNTIMVLQVAASKLIWAIDYRKSRSLIHGRYCGTAYETIIEIWWHLNATHWISNLIQTHRKTMISLSGASYPIFCWSTQYILTVGENLWLAVLRHIWGSTITKQ